VEISGREVVVAESEALERARGIVFEEDVCVGKHAEENVAAAWILEVEGDGLFAGIEHEKAVVGPVFRGRAFAQQFAGTGRFDLDDFGTEMGKLEAAVRARVDLGEFDNTITGKWQTHAISSQLTLVRSHGNANEG
jgi:hypothetical protein